MMRKTTVIASRSAAAIALLHLSATGASAQGILDQMEKIGLGLGRTGSALIGPIAFILAAVLLILGVWALHLGADKQNAGRGYYGRACMSFIAGFICAGLGTWAVLGSTTMTGAAPTATTSSFTFR